jgi:hypothetical protein
VDLPQILNNTHQYSKIEYTMEKIGHVNKGQILNIKQALTSTYISVLTY